MTKKTLTIAAVLLIGLLAALPAVADKAKSLFARGSDAEARQNYDQAYDFYKQAYDLKPKDVSYRAAYERMKFRAAAEHVHKGQQLRESGKLAEAMAEFESAIKIDPSNFMAVQEARRTKELMDQQANPDQQPKGPPTLSERVRNAGSPVELAAISNQPITLRMSSEDSKVVYETIGKLAGINVLFDPEYSSKRIKVDLNGVSLADALEIVALQSKTFWRTVTPNTIYVAADTTTKRKEIEQQVLRTFYLSNLSSSTELQDVSNVLRTVLELQRLTPLPSQNAIVVRGSLDQVALAEKVISDLDKARPEVLVEVAVMQVSRDKLRQLGIQYPFSTSANPTISLQNPSSTTTTNTNTNNGTTTPTTTSTGNLTLNDLANIDARNFQVSIPSASVAFLMNDSNTKVIQNPQIRSLDGQKASLKIGERIPVATGSFQPGVGGVVGVNPLVNTQFQYIDVGVNVDMTPHVYQNRDVDLKMMLEISAVDRFSSIGGIQPPVIGQRKTEMEVRLKEGEVTLLSGILEDSETKSMTGLPWLSQVPVLRYLFGQSQNERINNEVVFALIPHVVRGTDINDFNLKALDVGTQSQIGLKRASSTPATVPQVNSSRVMNGTSPSPVPPPQQTPAQPAGGMQPPPQQQPGTQNPNPQNQAATQSSPQQPQASATAGAPILSFDPPTLNAATNQTFAVNVSLVGGQNVFSVPAQISFDPKLLQLVNISNGGALSSDGQTVALVHREDQNAGSIQVSATRPPGTAGVNVNGPVFTLTFLAKAPGQGSLLINRAMLRDPNQTAIPASGSQAVVTIR